MKFYKFLCHKKNDAQILLNITNTQKYNKKIFCTRPGLMK